MQCEVVRAGNQFIERDQLNAGLARHRGGDERVAAQNLKAKTARALGNFKADAAQAKNAQRLAAQLRALQIFLLPLAGVH